METKYIFTRKKRFIHVLMACAAILVLITGCHKQQNTIDTSPVSIDQMIVSSNFDWMTTHDVNISLSAKDNQDNPIEGVRFTLYTASPDSGGVYLTSGITGADGVLKAVAVLPGTMNKVTVFNNFLGLIRQMEVPVTSGEINANFGGITPAPVSEKSGGLPLIQSPNAVKWVYMSSFNSQGVPNNLMPVNDPVNQTLLHDINTALPEYKNESVAHPEYFAAGVPKNIDVLTPSDIFITYITEGAGWMNSIGFFIFNTATPPASAALIDTIHVMFPNLSNTGSSGALNPGNKIHLGVFPAGKSIGWVVVPHGWNGLGTYVGPTSDVWYSIPAFNTTDPTMLSHMFQLKDVSRQQILLSFEDQGGYQGSDHDYNDGVFYLTINPLSSVNTTNMPQIATTVIDQDHDGVPDNSDDYPADPNKAFNNYTPSKTGYSSLVFEDLWPGKGDYDFNDMAVSYRFNQVTNAQNQVVEIDATLIPEAIGAAYHSGFAFQLPVTPDKIQHVTGTSLNHAYINLSANNTESGQSKAVIVAFDDAFDQLHYSGQGETGINTTVGAGYVTPDTLRLVISLNSPVAASVMGSPPYNPFIIVNRNRNREVHLANKPPTDKVDGTEFGTANDDSKPLQGRYYKTVNNLPWAMNITEKFQYPKEKTSIDAGYLHFVTWAQSAGAANSDWYKNLQGYRVSSKLFTH
ncbi:MAG: LruC domain-containing protein [Bacteroidota bacterium]